MRAPLTTTNAPNRATCMSITYLHLTGMLKDDDQMMAESGIPLTEIDEALHSLSEEEEDDEDKVEEEKDDGEEEEEITG
ncbi:hypothetical protein L1987_39747 [Smallanthus sonchifolius]|uniref:Uncharacterized protein n=1 Tax=Smallanthus sonchifolius TaxID=185202 RepID=A0ACB9HN45_9ASTR|nr:hypothetical protein L1987_39747 [Smallanthus sonchifolius]